MSERGSRRRRRWLIAGGVVIIVVAWFGYLASKAVSAYHHDQQGLAALEQIKSNLNATDLTSTASVQQLNAAQAEFAAASSDLSGPLFAPLTVVPVLGRQFRAIRSLSSAAGTVSRVGAAFITQVHGVLNENNGAGPQRVTALRQLSSASKSAEAQLAAVNTGPSQALVAPLASKRNEFVTQLNTARLRLVRAAGVSSVVATILQGPQNYLVLAANNAEMRAGSGTYLDVGVATTADGSVQLGSFGPSGDHLVPVGAVPVTGDLARNWGWFYPSISPANLGVTPQFDVTAPLAARMWAASTGQQVDGVIAIDVVALQQLLEATGPVEVDGQTVSAGTAQQYLLHDQYVGVSEYAANSRQDELGALASAVLSQLQGQTTDLKTLATAVSSAVAGRHLMVWSKNPAAQAAWTVSGVSGTLSPNSVDVALINLSGNKLDQFIPIHVSVSTAAAGSNTAVTMTTRMTNNTPPGEPQEVAGPFEGSPVSYGEYQGLASANLPGAASHITVSGAGPLAVKGGEGPTWALAVPVTLLPGQSATVTYHFVLPGSSGSMAVVPSARVPAEQWSANGRSFDDAVPTTISW